LLAASGAFTGAITGSSIISYWKCSTVGGNLGVSGTLAAGASVLASLVLGTVLARQYGGTGIDTSAAAAGQLLIGNNAGMQLATLTAGANITITNSPGGITIAAAGGGGGGSTSFNLTVDNSGAGDASGFTFNGSAAKKISYNSIGAKPIIPQIQAVTAAATVTPTFANDAS
jgi:hypothetical protein